MSAMSFKVSQMTILLSAVSHIRRGAFNVCRWAGVPLVLLAMLVLAMPTQAGTFTTTVQQAAGANWNQGIWNPGGVGASPGNDYICIAGGNPTRVRPPLTNTPTGSVGTGGTPVIFPGDSLTLEPGSEIRVKRGGSTGVTLKFPGVGGKPGLILNGGNITPGDPTPGDAFYIDGVIEVRSASSFDNEGDNARVLVLAAELRGSAMLSITHWTPGANVFTVTHANNPYSGTWNIAEGRTPAQGGVLVATTAGSLGSGSILVGPGCTIDIRYALNNPNGYLMLNNNYNGSTTIYATNILSSSQTYHDVNIGGTQLAPGTYTYAQLRAAFPGNFPAGGSGSITVLNVQHTLPTTLLNNFINIDGNPNGYLEGKSADPAGENYVMEGGGYDSWDNNDQMAFVWHRISGDFDIKVQVAHHQKAIHDGCCPKAGISARDSLAGDSKRVLMSVGAEGWNNNFEWLWRHGQKDVNAHNGGQTSDGYGIGQGYPNMWIRITRVGNLFTGYYGNDGTNWTAAGDPQDTGVWATGPLNKMLFVGLSLSKHDGNAPETTRATFQHYNETLAATNALCLMGADSLGCPTKIRLYFNHAVADDAVTNAGTGVYGLTGGSSPPFITGGSRVAPNIVDITTDGDLGANGNEGATYQVVVIGPIHDVQGNTLDQTSPCFAASFTHGLGFEAKKIHVLHNVPGSDQYGQENIDNFAAATSVKLGMGAQIDGWPPSADGEFDTGAGLRVFESPPGSGQDNSAVQIIGVLQPPADGNYVFAVASDDAFYNYLSTDDQPVNAVTIAHDTGWSGSRQYLQNGDNSSAPQALFATNKYFVKVINVNGGGGYNLAMTWDNGAGGGTIVNGQLPLDENKFVLSRYAFGQIFYNLGPATITKGAADDSKPIGGTARFVVSQDGTPPYTYQWYTNNPAVNPATSFVPVPYANSQVFTMPNVQEYQTNTRIYCVVGGACGGNVTSRVARLEVRLNPILLTIGSRGNCHEFFMHFNRGMTLGTFTPATVAVVCSNNTAPGNPTTALAVGPFSYGTNHNEIIVAVSPDLLANTNTYYVTLTGVFAEAGFVIAPNPTQTTFIHGSEFVGPFGVLFELYYNPAGVGGPVALNTFFNFPNYVSHKPDWSIGYYTAFETPWTDFPLGVNDNYGAEFKGFWTVPVDGDYRFWCASDDFSQTFIATDAVPNHRTLICLEPQWAGYRNFADAGEGVNGGRGGPPPSNESPAIPLKAGQVVYLQGDYTEGGGGDHYSLTYTVTAYGNPDPGAPANGTPSAIMAADFAQRRVSPSGCTFINLCNIYFLQVPSDQTNYIGLNNTFAAVVDGTPAAATCYYYQWLSNNVIIPGAVGASYTTPPLTAANDKDVYTVIASNDFSQVLARATNYVRPNPVEVRCTTLNDPNDLYVFWSKPVQGVGSYTINDLFVNGTTVKGTIVACATDPIAPGTTHTLTIIGEVDLDGNPQVGSDGSIGGTIVCEFTQFPPGFCTDFSGGLPVGTISSGTIPPAVGGDGALHMTDAPNNSNANYWNVPFASLQTFNFFSASWQQLVGPGSGGIGNSADGMSFNVGQSVGTGFTPEEGAATGLSATVDTYDNGGGEVGIEVRWNGARLAFTQIGGGGTAPAALMKNTWVPATLDVTPSGLATFHYDTYVVSAQIPNYTGITANQCVFAARTGGANETCEIDNVCIMNYTLGAAAATLSPGDVTVGECTSVSYTATLSGSPYLTYQWLRNGVPIPGAGGGAPPSGVVAYTTPLLKCATDQGVKYSVMVSNSFSVVTSAVSVVTLTCDNTPETIVSAGSLTGCELDVCMSKPADPATATNKLNWTINGGAPGAGIVRITIEPNGSSLRITINPCLTSAGTFTVSETGVKDACPGANATTSSVVGTYVGLAVSDTVGGPTPRGSDFACQNQFTLTAGGADVWDGGDNCHFVYVPRCGDFDVKVKVVNVPYIGSPWSKAGLMTRVSTETCSAMATIYHDTEGAGGANAIETASRYSACNINDIGPNRPAASSYPWLRMKRIGDQILLYYGVDGVNWIVSGDTGTAACGGLPSTLLVGVFVVSHLDGTGVTATMSDFAISPQAAGPCPTPIGVTVSPPVAQVGECGTATFTASAAICSLNNSLYQWFRNGVPIPGANGLDYSTPAAVCLDNNAVFTFGISNQVSGSVGIASGTLKVQCGVSAPVITAVGSLSGCAIGVRFNRPVDPATAGNPANYSINGGAPGDNIASIVLGPDHYAANETVSINLVNCLLGGKFSVCANGVLESCSMAFASSSCATGIVQGLLYSDVGVGVGGPTPDPNPPGLNFTTDTNEFQVTVGGNDLWGNSDHGQFVFTHRCGDFDVKMKVESLLYVGSYWSKAGLMARASLDTASAMTTSYQTPYFGGGANVIESAYRAVQGGNIDDNVGGFNLNNSGETMGRLHPYQPAASGNAWLRMQRTGDQFIFSHSMDGVNWEAHADTTATPQGGLLPQTVYVGAFVSPNVGNDGRTTTVRIQGFQISPQNAALIATCNDKLTVTYSAPNVTIAWPGGNCCRLQGATTLSSDKRYQTTAWVDIPGTSPVTLPANGFQFFRTIAP